MFALLTNYGLWIAFKTLVTYYVIQVFGILP